MMHSVTNNIPALRKRLNRFFDEKVSHRARLNGFVNQLSDVADVYIFGGLIREFTFKSIKNFKSDVDIVVQVKDRAKYQELLNSHNHDQNKFGGYRLALNQWLVDLWEFEDTWAFKEAIVQCDEATSLLDTTFFNWDAAFYHYNSKKIECKANYLQDISSKILDINLEKNPNEFGAFIRSLKLIARTQAKTKSQLSSFIMNFLPETNDEDIKAYEYDHFKTCFLDDDFLHVARERSQLWNNQETFSWATEKQHELPITNH